VNDRTSSDLPLDQLVPGQTRPINPEYRQRLEASLRTSGLFEPLIVFAQDDHYEILDGNLRFHILRQMGVATVPCIIIRFLAWENHHE
jgi:ParB-like chromosome segregation protein Spo0J